MPLLSSNIVRSLPIYINNGLAYLTLSCGILYFSLPHSAFWPVSITLFLIHFKPQLRPYVVALSSLSFWYLSDLSFGIFTSPTLINTYPMNRILTPSILIFFLICYGYIFFKISQSYRLLYLGGSYVLIYPILLDYTQTSILVLYISIFFKSYLYWLAVLHRKAILGFRELLLTIFTSFPFFAINVSSPIVDESSDCSPISSLKKEDLPTLQLKGFSILLYALLTLIIINTINFVIFGENPSFINLSDYLPSLDLRGFKGGLSVAQAHNPDWWMRWIVFIFIFINYYLKIAYSFGIAVGIARLAGYPMPPMFNSPWKARSFAEFYGRLIHYYGYFLMTVFYPTFKNLFSPIKNAYVKTYLSLWLSIFSGGFIFHFTNELFVLSDSNSLYETLASFTQGAWIYFSIIASFSCLSLYLRRFTFRIQLGQFKPIIYLIGGSLIFSIYHLRGGLGLSWTDYFSYMLGLIPRL